MIGVNRSSQKHLQHVLNEYRRSKLSVNGGLSPGYVPGKRYLWIDSYLTNLISSGMSLSTHTQTNTTYNYRIRPSLWPSGAWSPRWNSTTILLPWPIVAGSSRRWVKMRTIISKYWKVLCLDMSKLIQLPRSIPILRVIHQRLPLTPMWMRPPPLRINPWKQQPLRENG